MKVKNQKWLSAIKFKASILRRKWVIDLKKVPDLYEIKKSSKSLIFLILKGHTDQKIWCY